MRAVAARPGLKAADFEKLAAAGVMGEVVAIGAEEG